MITSIVEMWDFETTENSISENRKRINALWNIGEKEHRELAYRLEDCTDGYSECKSLACKLCNRELRIKNVDGSVAKILASCDDWQMLTYVDYKQAFSHEDLREFSIQKSKGRLRKLFERYEFHGPIWGTLELDYHGYADLWLPHYHCILPCSEANTKAYSALLQARTIKNAQHIRQDVQARPLNCEGFSRKDTVRTVSYTHKLYFTEVIAFQTKNGIRTDKRRLDTQKMSDSLLLLDSWKYKTIRFQFDVQGRW